MLSVKNFLIVLGCTLFILLFIGVVVVSVSHKGRSLSDMIDGDEDVGEPLFLTPLIEDGQIHKAQHLSKVEPAIGNVKSYSGFLTTNKSCGNNLFFWFFPAQEDWVNAPLVLWLQGGPADSSMLGLFEEIGPFYHSPDGLKMRTYSWNVKNNLLFIDQPVGTGYSFTEEGCYATDETGVGENLYSALVQFLRLFPKLQKNKFFVAGESYAGHYIPAIGYTIDKKNPTAKAKINLAGMMIGNGWTDPREQINYGDYLYQIGLIDDNGREQFYALQKLLVQKIDAEDWKGAFQIYANIIGLIGNTNLNDRSLDAVLYNYLPQKPDSSDWTKYIQSSDTRISIHVGNATFSNRKELTGSFNEVRMNLLESDLMKSMKPVVEALLDEGYPMVFYVGQVDVICAYPMVVNFLRSLHWSGRADYLNATRTKWVEGDDLAGYIKVSHNLAEVLVRGAGHMVPKDQPFWAYRLVDQFTSGGIRALSNS